MVTYFLLHNNSIDIIFLNWKKVLSEGKKDIEERTRPSLYDANYDHENDDSTNDLRPRSFK